MSEKGIPVQGGSVAVDMVRTTTATNTQNSVDPNMIQLWKFIYIDMTFVKSIIGILVAVETVGTHVISLGRLVWSLTAQSTLFRSCRAGQFT